MVIHNIEEMRDGWIIGDFSPAAISTKSGEVSIKNYSRYHTECGFCHDGATVMYMLLSGVIRLNGQILDREYQMAVFAPDESVWLTAITDARVMLFVAGLKSFTRLKGLRLDKLLDMCDVFEPFEKERNAANFDCAELSFVVQGAVDPLLTPICTESIRHFFPGSTIILSTWKGSALTGLDYDILVENDDPGGIPWSFKESPNTSINTNRQLVSTVNGLERVTTAYAMKIRTDAVLTGRRITSYLGAYPMRLDAMKLFDERVIISELFNRRYYSYQRDMRTYRVPHLFHVSDWFFLGQTADLKRYFCGTRQVTEDESVAAPLANAYMRTDNRYFWNWRYTTEQHYTMEALNRAFPGTMEKYRDWTDWSRDAEDLSDLFMGNNFTVLDFEHHGVLLPKYEIIMTDSGLRRDKAGGLFDMELFEDYYRTKICTY